MSGSGKIVDGRFRLERPVGSGGMGDVYLATDLHTNRPVAIKVLRAMCANSQDAHLRLSREIEVLSRLHSPYVAELFCAGRLLDSSPYFVMEYLEGRDLKAEVRRRGPIPIAEAAAYLVQACRGISVAHQQGIVHRDLKPHNLIVTKLDGARLLKIVDFGVAKVLDSVDPGLTATDTIVGTPLYLPPELLLDSKAITTKVDIWALGVILYELLTGFSPFSDDSPGAVIAAITLDEPVPIRQIRPEIPEEVEELIESALAKPPMERLDSAFEFEQRLLPFATPPEQLVVPAAVDQQTIVTLPRPPRTRCLVDLRSKIRVVVDTATLAEPTTGRRRATEGNLAPQVERLSVLPSLRGLPISAPIAANGVAKPAKQPRRTQERAEPPLLATVEQKRPHEPVTVPPTRSPNRRLMLALPFALVFAALPFVPWQGQRHRDRAEQGSAGNPSQPKLELELAQSSLIKVGQPTVDVPSEMPARVVGSPSVEAPMASTPRQRRKPSRGTLVAVPTSTKASSPGSNTAQAVPLRL